MKIAVVGGGPGGLYFAILMKQADPAHQITVFERNRPDDTFGFGVVFSDATIAQVEGADRDTYESITRHFFHWDNIDVHYGGECLSTTGHGFSGMSRQLLLTVLQERAAALGVQIRYETEVTDLGPFEDWDLVVGADGLNSTVRKLREAHFQPRVDLRPNRFVWLGTTRRFPAFTFDFRENEHGLWRVHAYQYRKAEEVTDGEPISTFIVECTDESWRAAGFGENENEEATAAYCAELFADLLGGHPLVTNRSLWRQFPTLECRNWSDGNVVLLGDAVHTAHFSVGSGTRMAMLDAISLREALTHPEDPALPGNPSSLGRALARYEEERRPQVESLQRAAEASLQWFEDTERYMELPPLQFTFALLTRSLRITHEDIRLRDPAFLERVDGWFAEEARAQAGTSGAPAGAPDRPVSPPAPPPPAFTPFRLRDMLLENRVAVSPMCQYCAEDGMPNDWHLVHLGSRAIG